MATDHEWSQYQQNYFDWVKSGRGSAVVIAVAGAGKTTILVEGSKLMRGSVASAMYNKKNATEFQDRLSQAGITPKDHRAGTFHSFGFSALRRVYPDARVDERVKTKRLVEECKVEEDLAAFSTKLVSLAKQSAFGLLANPNDESAWWKLVRHHDLDADLEDPERAKEGLRAAYKMFKLSREICREVIDFDDMVYMPVVTNVRVWQNDWLLVDEAQDTNPARRALARKMLRPGGRAVFVGDPAQAIYGFTGADNDSIDLIKRKFNAIELPLTISYRCPQAVVREAQAVVSHIEASPVAAEGLVRGCDMEDFISTKCGKCNGSGFCPECVETSTPGRRPAVEKLSKDDAILCRKTAPLAKLAFALIKDGTPCHLEGREIGAGLVALVDRWKVKTATALRDKLNAYCERQVAKLMAKGSEAAADALADRVGTLLVLAEGCETVLEVREKIERMFADNAPTLTLSTVHKAKGREWGRVFILGRHQFMPSPWARQEWQAQQENNLIYVAVTRSKAELVYVAVPHV